MSAARLATSLSPGRFASEQICDPVFPLNVEPTPIAPLDAVPAAAPSAPSDWVPTTAPAPNPTVVDGVGAGAGAVCGAGSATTGMGALVGATCCVGRAATRDGVVCGDGAEVAFLVETDSGGGRGARAAGIVVAVSPSDGVVAGAAELPASVKSRMSSESVDATRLLRSQAVPAPTANSDRPQTRIRRTSKNDDSCGTVRSILAKECGLRR